MRTRSLDGFILVGRSVESKIPRGGVTIYKNLRLEVELDILSMAFRGCAVFKIRNSGVVLAAMYIPMKLRIL